MRTPYTQLYLHLVWATWERHPLITPGLRDELYAVLAHRARESRADAIAIGGMEDHVHMLLRLPTTVAIGTLVKSLKGASSHMVTHVMRHPEAFKWQGGYGAFTLSKRGVPMVRDYIENQERHHRAGTLLPALERTEESS